MPPGTPCLNLRWWASRLVLPRGFAEPDDLDKLLPFFRDRPRCARLRAGGRAARAKDLNGASSRNARAVLYLSSLE